MTIPTISFAAKKLKSAFLPVAHDRLNRFLVVVLIVGMDPALADRRCTKRGGIGEGGKTGDTFPAAIGGGGASKTDSTAAPIA